MSHPCKRCGDPIEIHDSEGCPNCPCPVPGRSGDEDSVSLNSLDLINSMVGYYPPACPDYSEPTVKVVPPASGEEART
jgi:predicted  nucleic acid-binding Zn-ribbon protein